MNVISVPRNCLFVLSRNKYQDTMTLGKANNHSSSQHVHVHNVYCSVVSTMAIFMIMPTGASECTAQCSAVQCSAGQCRTGQLLEGTS